MGPQLTIIVATRNRATALTDMLRTLDVSVRAVAAPVEVIVVDNGSNDSTAEIVSAWRTQAADRVVLRVDERGKARALNAAVRQARGDLLAFTDDDVEVPETWVASVLEFFDTHSEYAAATGRIRLPPSVTDPKLLSRIEVFRTLPLFDRGDDVQDTTHLYGCNMALRRSTFEATGEFDERLGPGASGLHEDGDLAERVGGAGLRIAYAPQILMYHTADPSRLTWEFFTYLHRADARSRFVQRGGCGVGKALWHYAGSVFTWLLWNLMLNPRRRMRARGRMLSHRESLRLSLSAGRSIQT